MSKLNSIDHENFKAYNQPYLMIKTYRQNKGLIFMIYGYARVSTAGQANDGNSLEAQEKTLKEHGTEIIYSDSFTGTKLERPDFSELLAALQNGDTLIVTKLDRIARSLMEGNALVNSLLERNVRVHILNLGVMDNTPASKLIRNIFLSFAEFERDMIVERTQEGKELARMREGFREGRPKKFTAEQMEHALNLLETNSYKQVERMTKISVSTLVRARRGQRSM
jgi:DNA invertase Pin-like site-specific DNA recombinase